MRRIVLALIAFFSIGFGGAAFAADQPPQITLRIGAQPDASVTTLWIAHDLGYLKEELEKVGATYTWLLFPNGPLVNEAEKAGEIDVGVMGDLPAIIAKSVGQNVTIFAHLAYGEKALALIVPFDSEIKEVKDIKGKKIAYVKGSYAQHLLALLLKNSGLKPSDIKAINLAAGDVPTAIQTKQIDGAVIWEQFISQLLVAKQAKVIADGTGIKRGNNVVYTTNSFAKAHPEVLVAFVKALDRGAQYVNKDKKAAANLLAKHYKITPELLEVVFDSFVFAAKFTPEDIKEIERVKDYSFQAKIIRKNVKIEDLVTTKYIDAAGIK